MRIFSAGVEPEARKEIWKYLLGMYPAGKTAAQRQVLMQSLRQEYEDIKAQWTTISGKQAARCGSCTCTRFHFLGLWTLKVTAELTRHEIQPSTRCMQRHELPWKGSHESLICYIVKFNRISRVPVAACHQKATIIIVIIVNLCLQQNSPATIHSQGTSSRPPFLGSVWKLFFLINSWQGFGKVRSLPNPGRQSNWSRVRRH